MNKKHQIKESLNFKIVATKIFVFVTSLILFFELFLYRSRADLIIKLSIFLLVVYASIYLVKSVKYEIESRKKMEQLAEEFTVINEDLNELNRQKSEFVIKSSYHLMTPLTSISEYASMALSGSFGELSVEVKKAIDRIFKSSKRLAVIIDDFTNISRIESGEMEYVFNVSDMAKIIADVFADMSIAAKEANLKLDYEIEKGNNYKIKIDDGKIRQVVSNIIDNAIKYTPNGSVRGSLKKLSNGNILLKIYDTGIGMDKETSLKIFKKFSRAKDASKFYTEGSGLGLYVAYEILKKHNARIWAESDGVGKGSAFFVEFNTKSYGKEISKK